MPGTELTFRQGPLSVNLRQPSEVDVSWTILGGQVVKAKTETLTATLHATGRKLEITVREPFNTLELNIEGTRLELFLSDTQLEDLAGVLANAVALRAERGR